MPERSLAALRDRWAAVEAVRARELAELTAERAREMILSLGAVAVWRERPDWSGLVDQQRLFHRRPS